MIFYTFIHSWSARHGLITTYPFVSDEDNKYDDKDEDDGDNLDSDSRDGDNNNNNDGDDNGPVDLLIRQFGGLISLCTSFISFSFQVTYITEGSLCIWDDNCILSAHIISRHII
jgi:hypothetical protein